MSFLTHIKFDMNNMASNIQIMGKNIEALMANKLNKTYTENNENNFDINDIFPIETDDALEEFEFKLKRNENNFKHLLVKLFKFVIYVSVFLLYLTFQVRKLSLLVTTKSLGDSMRRIMSRMFDDNILQNYSTYGYKKKNRFASLESYCIIIGNYIYIYIY